MRRRHSQLERLSLDGAHGAVSSGAGVRALLSHLLASTQDGGATGSDAPTSATSRKEEFGDVITGRSTKTHAQKEAAQEGESLVS